MDSSSLKIPDYYIAQKEDGKEQIVKYDQKDENNKYYGYYGINSYHEVVTKREKIRELTTEERSLFSNKKYWSLPQQFYHSFPEI